MSGYQICFRAQTYTFLSIHDYDHTIKTIITCQSTNVFGHKHMWAQSCLGTNVSGHKHVWAQTCLGTNVCGQKRVWARSCGLKYVPMGTNVWSPLQPCVVCTNEIHLVSGTIHFVNLWLLLVKTWVLLSKMELSKVENRWFKINIVPNQCYISCPPNMYE